MELAARKSEQELISSAQKLFGRHSQQGFAQRMLCRGGRRRQDLRVKHSLAAMILWFFLVRRFPAGSALNQQNCSSDRMIITDTDDCTRFIPRNDILYATSDGRNCQICCFSGKINARINISSFVEKAGGRFVLIHRCYAINLDHITLLKPYCVVMSNGSELPVPVKRYNEIKQRLTELFSNI